MTKDKLVKREGESEKDFLDDLNVADPQLLNLGAAEPSQRLDLPATSAVEESYRLSVSNAQETDKSPSKNSVR